MDARVFLAVHSLSLCAEEIEEPGPRTRASNQLMLDSLGSCLATAFTSLSYPICLTGLAHLSEEARVP